MFGWDGNNKLSNKKVIDIMYITKNGQIRFGANLFKVGRGYKKRVFFEFSSEVVMSLKYHARTKRIVFAHLAPLEQNLKGQRQFYGPDLSLDAFQYKKGKWKFLSDIEQNNSAKPKVKIDSPGHGLTPNKK